MKDTTVSKSQNTGNTVAMMDELEQNISQKLISTGRAGIPELLVHLKQIGYYTAPASCATHLAVPGGLALHSWIVMEHALKTNLTWAERCDENEIIVSALLHDVGNCGQYGKPAFVENLLSDGTQCAKKPYKVNRELYGVAHEVRSVAHVSRFIQLTEDEQHAILYHHSMYGSPNHTRNSGSKQVALQELLRSSDAWCRHFVETKNHVA